jgi:peroxiredoxin Q/BCP
MAAKKRSGKKAHASKARSKKASTRAGASKKASKKAGKRKKKASKKASAVVAAAPVAKKKASKKRASKKRAGKKSPAPAPERVAPPVESDEGEGPMDSDDDDDGDDGDESPGDDDEPDEGELGDPAPHFELLDQHGRTVSSDDLAGKPYVLYFYPKDDTPGCTSEACGFRDAQSAFEEAGVAVLGVSPDTTASHKKFADKCGLTFQLLSDPDKILAKAYGTWALKKNYGKEYMGIERSTFLVGADGRIKQVWRRVRVNGHVDAVQQAAASL